MLKHRTFVLAVVTILVLVTLSLAQRGRRRYRGDRDRYGRNGVPQWEIDKDFRHDVFTFARLRYDSAYRRGGGWRTDYPDSDLNFSFRLQQLTSLQVDPIQEGAG